MPLPTSEVARSKKEPNPPRRTVSHPGLRVTWYATPNRGAMLPYVVVNGGVPAGARATWDRSLRLNPVTAGMLGLDEGAKSTSHRKPYVSVNRGITRHVSCAKAPRLCSRMGTLRCELTNE